jgi:hypothetical protein
MQVTSLKLSKKLTELGVEVGTYLRWCYSDVYNDSYIISVGEYSKKPFRHESICVAFTLDEILELLPDVIEKHPFDIDIPFKFVLGKNNKHNLYFAAYIDSFYDEDIFFVSFNHKNPAEAAGQLLVWCVENGHVETGKADKAREENVK